MKLAFCLLALGLFAGATATAGLTGHEDTCGTLIVPEMVFNHSC